MLEQLCIAISKSILEVSESAFADGKRSQWGKYLTGPNSFRMASVKVSDKVILTKKKPKRVLFKRSFPLRLLMSYPAA